MKNSKVAELQRWLNAHGAFLEVDGIGGPQTRKAVLATFKNPNLVKSRPTVNKNDIVALASRYGISLKSIRTIAKVESRGNGWGSDGVHLKCLWERHYMWKRIRKVVPLLSNPRPGGYTLDANRNGVNDSWEKVADAACRWGITAFECASWGKFQIMGAWAKDLGYQNAAEFVWALSQNEAAHYEALCRFIHANGLTKAANRISLNPEDNRAFARGYNGRGYKKNRYHVKLAVEAVL